MADEVINLPLPENLSIEQALGYAARRIGELKNVYILAELKGGGYASVHGGHIVNQETLWLLEMEKQRVVRHASIQSLANADDTEDPA